MNLIIIIIIINSYIRHVVADVKIVIVTVFLKHFVSTLYKFVFFFF